MKIPAHNFTSDEFHVFVMLYAANTDGEITPEEESLMTTVLTPEQYTAVRQIFDQCDDNQALECIFSYREKYLATKADREQVMKDMATIYNISNHYHALERSVQKLFERMLNSL